ncbi:hypothetical protein HID58_007065 [Brassica napus]|uniref:Uncharacterized protein n=1 Tax=Brassica napus TaxID=3708 RepID=A0ABQ8ED47_BRANA|nr:hypothetical protein HID58_007065 [Brassica napus]
MANSYTLLANLRAGRCSNTAEVRLLRFWEARNINKGGELMSIEWTDSLIPSNAFSPEDMATEEPCDITCRFCDGLLAIQDYPQGFPRPVLWLCRDINGNAKSSDKRDDTESISCYRSRVSFSFSKLWSTMRVWQLLALALLLERTGSGGISAIQLSSEHNANNEDVRFELKDLHPDDPQIVVFKHGVGELRGSSK